MKDIIKTKITYNTYNINNAIPIDQQIFELNEDLMQINVYNDTNILLIDIGWYPSGNIDGKLVARIIREYNWEEPVYKKSLNYMIIEQEITELIDIAKVKLSNYEY